MPKSTIGGDDPFFKLSDKDREKKAKELLKKSKEELIKHNIKESKELKNRAWNLLRRRSKKTQHH